MRKQSESEDGGEERVERDLRLMRLENTPEGRVVSWLLPRYEEQMKVKMRERRREKWNERETRLSRHSKTPEGREVREL